MAPAQDPKAEQVSINASELREANNAVLMRLMGLQTYVNDLTKAYVEHTTSVLAGGPATINIPAAPPNLEPSKFLRASTPEAKSEAGVKKRKRTPADPNAPKRPLTPYFLYMHNNRNKIAGEMGSDTKPKDVSDEGTKRWQEMDEPQKAIWKDLYAENYEKYKRDVAAYKSKTSDRKTEDDLDPAASQLQQDFAGADADKTDSSSEDEEEEESSPSPPPKEKTPRSTKRRRSDAKVVKEVPESATKQVSPVKRGRKKAEPVKETTAPEAKTKGKGKKRKSEA
ncbi:High mobility group superfamily [Penicillium angulare]|uniref:High mobility group superfamily n=1 Tax=Penicillium angulare TaxID=116970 RepID=UPI002541507F|nr:High mobility group superfamily [Penicillium angulare]KAJ5278815.1 High mobility group superfamily [Penicillium angulare]